MALTSAQIVICVVFATVFSLPVFAFWVLIIKAIGQSIRERDARALYNRQRKAQRDREDREAERAADRKAEWHRKLRGDA